MARRSIPIAAFLLLCAVPAIARKSSRRRPENDLGLEKKGRASRKETSLLHTFDEAFSTDTSEQLDEQPEMEIDCIRRHDKGKGKGIGKNKSKKSKSSTYFCSENGGIPSEESAPLSTLIPTPAPIELPSSESVDIPSAESIPVSASVAPSILEQVAFSSTPEFLSLTSFPTAENSVSPSLGERSVVPSVLLPVAGTSAENAPTQIVSSAPIPVPLRSTPPDSGPVISSDSPTTYPTPVRSPAASIEPSSPITNEVDDTPSDNALVRICNSFLAGAAPTFGPKIKFETKIVLLLDGKVPTQRVLLQIHGILTYEVAPALLGCASLSSGGSGRRVQVVVSGLRNLVFDIPTENPAGVASISGIAYYSGAYPDGLYDALRSAILSSDLLGVEGLAGFGDNFEFKDTNEVLPVDSPTDFPADDGINEGNENQGKINKSEQRTGVFVGVVVAGMVAALSFIFATSASRRRRTIGRQMKHQKLEEILTDDESNQYSMSDHDTAPDDGEDMWIAHVVDDQDSGIISWGSQTPSIASHRYESRYYPSRGLQFEEGLQYHNRNSLEHENQYSFSEVPNSLYSSRFHKENLVQDTVVL